MRDQYRFYRFYTFLTIPTGYSRPVYNRHLCIALPHTHYTPYTGIYGFDVLSPVWNRHGRGPGMDVFEKVYDDSTALQELLYRIKQSRDYSAAYKYIPWTDIVPESFSEYKLNGGGSDDTQSK